MSRKSKRLQDIYKELDTQNSYSLKEAIALLRGFPIVKFDQSVEMSLKMGVDPRKSDQQVRGTVSLPHGTGKVVTVVVFAKGDKAQEALDAGADHVGTDELFEKIKGGWTDFDAVITTPDLMREVGKFGKILGPRGLMPSPKAGTVTENISDAVKEIQAGKIEFKVDRHGVINVALGKISFDVNDLLENFQTFLHAVKKLKPAALKGQYMRSLYVSTTMGPGLRIENREFQMAT